MVSSPLVHIHPCSPVPYCVLLGDLCPPQVKFISDKDTDKILGAWIMGPNAGELIPECVLAMAFCLSSGITH